MKVLILQRVHSDDTGTYGTLKEEGFPPFCLTLELPWRDNRHDESCIPGNAEYLCQKTTRLTVGLTFEVLQVPSRDSILIHKGNNVGNSRGCILLGEQFEDVLSADGKALIHSVLSSGKAYSEFIQKMTGQDQFKLVVK